MARLRWQCRRGMLELDTILRRYLDERYAYAKEWERSQFHELLTVEDPVLNQWLIHGDIPSDEPLKAIVQRVRA